MLTQALISKGLETVQLSDALIVAPESARARATLTEQLSGLRQAAAHLGFVQLENALGEALGRLVRESFSREALDAVRSLAGRYVSLATAPDGSGTHPVAFDAGEPPSAKVSLRGRRVLVAIDEAAVRWSYVGILRDAGARVTEARDGLEAFELAQRNAPDLILADIVMPRLDGLGLCAAVRRERSLDAVPVVLLSARGGEPRQALFEAGAGSRPLVEALIEVLGVGEQEARVAEVPQRLEETSADDDGPDPQRTLRAPEAAQESALMTDPLERENIRAQSAVAMHRDPANRAPGLSYPIWRVSLGSGSTAGALTSGFDAELQTISRVLGAGFIALLVGTIVILVWSQWSAPIPSAAPLLAEPAEVTRIERVAVEVEAPPPEPVPSQSGEGLAAFSGALVPGVDAELGIGEGQGVLELDGPSQVTVEIDGMDHGALPVQVALDQGRHVVRYHLGSRSTYRFYTVKPGSTRVLRVVTKPGGLIDAR